MNTTGITLDMEIAAEDEDVPKPGQLQHWLTAYTQWLCAHLSVTDSTVRFQDDAQQQFFAQSLSLLAERSAPVAPFLLSQKPSAEHTPLESFIALRIVSAEESQTLNGQYRQKNRPTNVLSFPGLYQPKQYMTQLGDLAICASVVTQEALNQKKSPEAHWAHLLLHGTLHLLGFDHETETDAELMESLETQMLASLGFNDPYVSIDDEIIDDTPIDGAKAVFEKDNLNQRESHSFDSRSVTATTPKPITEA